MSHYPLRMAYSTWPSPVIPLPSSSLTQRGASPWLLGQLSRNRVGRDRYLFIANLRSPMG